MMGSEATAKWALRFIRSMQDATVYSHDDFLCKAVPKPFIGLGGECIKPRVRVKAYNRPAVRFGRFGAPEFEAA